MTYRFPTRALGLALALAFSPAASFGQSTDSLSSPAATLAETARAHEKGRRWEEAFQVWLRVLNVDKANTEARDRLPVVLRHALQSNRHRDPALLARVHAMTQAEALALYAEVLTKIQTYYVDPDKSTTARLFRQGLDEYTAALTDPQFAERYLKGVDESAVIKFRAHLQKAWVGREITTIRQAVEVVAEVGAASRRVLNLRAVNPVVAEFICGACNSLDEFSSYLAGPQYTMEPAGPPARTVEVRAHEFGVIGMKITQFLSTTPQEVVEALKPFVMSGEARALILDLRGNTGGSFTAAVKTAEKFLPGGIIVTAQGQHEEVNKVYSSLSGAAASDIPMVVLVDGDTASAAEVLAVALRDNRRAKLIGTATFGKGSVQNVVKFSTAEEADDSGKPRPRAAMRITLARLIAPSGAPISGVGVTPDQIIADRDRQDELALEQARELSRRYMPMMRP